MENYYKCRLCLEESSRNIDIFKEDFSNMIELLTGLKVDPEDGLPTKSCLQCHKEVKSAMLTRYQIINSHKILINELNAQLKVPIDDTKPSLFGFCLPSVPSKECITQGDKGHNINNPYDEITEFMESEINNIDSIKNEIRSHQLNSQNAELFEQKDIIKNDDLPVDCYDSIEDSCEENEIFDIPSKNISSHKNVDQNNEAMANITEKQKFDNLSMKLRSRRKVANQDIKFRRKRGYKEQLPQKKVQFKKKSQADPYHVKVDYDIKPEHIEFLKTVGKKDRVACPICRREMYGMNMKNHLITHNFDPVICDTCGKTSKNAQALQDHINYYHKTTPDRFMCDKCGKGYRVRFMLERHEKKEHGNGEKDFECTVCGKKFFEKLQLKNHINITHNKIKPFKCEHCGKDFGRRTQFVTHQLVHTKENRYHCQVCGKGFKIKQTMQTHLKGVHGIEEEKTIFCKICQKGFSSAQGLRAHVNSRVHGLEKCEHCSEFITLEYKDIHLREIHGIETKNMFS